MICRVLTIALEKQSYRLDTLKLLMRNEQQPNPTCVKLSEQLLGHLVTYERPMGDIHHYDKLLTGANT